MAVDIPRENLKFLVRLSDIVAQVNGKLFPNPDLKSVAKDRRSGKKL